jgi:hypothetical protein
MRLPVRCVLCVLPLLLTASGCQSPIYETTVTIPAKQSKELKFGASPDARDLVVAIDASEGPLNAYVVNANKAKAVDAALAASKDPPAQAVFASKETEEDADYRFDATVPAQTPYTLLLRAGPKSADVKVKVFTLNLLIADSLFLLHLSFVAFVALGQLVIVAGWLLRWGFVRNFWFRLIHFLSIAFVVGQAARGIQCFLTLWEADYRGGNVYNLKGASAIVRWCNGILYPTTNMQLFLWIYVGFGLLVVLTTVLAPPRWPWRKTVPSE